VNPHNEQSDDQSDDRASPSSDLTPPVAPGGGIGYMSDQIAMMRRENPDVWRRIDELCDGKFDATAFRRFFTHGGGPCDKCGYDLMGNMSGRCPECGTPVVVSAHARRAVSIYIMEALRRRDPDRWNEVAARLERERLETVNREYAREGARRDEIRNKALKNWLQRKREQSSE